MRTAEGTFIMLSMTSAPRLAGLLDAALAAAGAAAPVIMQHYRSGTTVERKADDSPVTIADREAELIIKAAIAGRFPDHGFLGEEFGAGGGDGGFVWIIDPIDGTRNFVRGIPLFGTQIALMQELRLVLGVSNMPAMDELLYGGGGTAYLNGAPVRVSTIDRLAESAVSFAGLNRRRGPIRPENLIALFDAIERVRGFGDCYPFHLVASGRLEAVIQPQIKIWDIGALAAIIEAAGGRCTDLDGKPITIATDGILASNGLIHDEILALIHR